MDYHSMPQRVEASPASRAPRTTRLVMATLSMGLVLTAGFARATPDGGMVGAALADNTVTGVLLTPFFHAMAARRSNGRHPAASKKDTAASLSADEWVSSPPMPLMPSSP